MRATAHYWITGGRRPDREDVIAGLPLATPLAPVIDAHRRLRGPYTAAGSLIRALVPEVLERDPGLVRRYDIELLSASPELAAVVPNSRETLTSMAIPAERTRYYARLRTRRIANGLVEFLLGAFPPGRRALIVENADQADSTDLEFLAAALRRADPAGITLVVCSATAELADDTLLAALADHAETVQVQSPADADGAAGHDLSSAAAAGGSGPRLDALAGLRHDPGHAYLHVILGRVHAAVDDIPAALAAYDEALCADPALQAAWAGRGEVLFSAGDYGGAIASLNQALAISDDAAILFNRATVAQAEGRWADALADLDRAADLDPADPDIHEQIECCSKMLQAK